MMTKNDSKHNENSECENIFWNLFPSFLISIFLELILLVWVGHPLVLSRTILRTHKSSRVLVVGDDRFVHDFGHGFEDILK